MATHIIEYIGKDKLVHTEYNYLRMKRPRPGDFVDFGENTGEYPFTHGQYGRIDNMNLCDTGLIMICCELGSCFLGEDYVSISGGPFITIHPDELQKTIELHTGRFWNWGNNSKGGGKGVHYILTRPVFRLKKRDQKEKDIVRKAFENGNNQ